MTPESLELLRAINTKQDRLIERLFGDLDSENPKARFPLLEEQQHSNTKRLQKLENDRIRVYSIGSVISIIGGWIAELFIHGRL